MNFIELFISTSHLVLFFFFFNFYCSGYLPNKSQNKAGMQSYFCKSVGSQLPKSFSFLSYKVGEPNHPFSFVLTKKWKGPGPSALMEITSLKGDQIQECGIQIYRLYYLQPLGLQIINHYEKKASQETDFQAQLKSIKNLNFSVRMQTTADPGKTFILRLGSYQIFQYF